MRTTLTLDDDNAARLERLRKHRDVSLKEVVNDAIRRGLDAVEKPVLGRAPVKMPVLTAGKPLFNSPEELKALMNEIQEEDLAKLRRS